MPEPVLPHDDVETHTPIALALEPGVTPELIAATASLESPRVLIEGHSRLTTYALFPKCLPPWLEVLLGFSPAIASWCEF